VLVNRRTASETERLVEKAGGQATSIVCDISKEGEVKAMGRKAAEVLGGKIDILINDAGFNGKASLVKDMKLADWDYTLRVNLTGTMLVCREIIPYMIQRKSGKILNMASNVGRRGLPLRADYVCSKWALLGFTQTLALELVDHNIRVNAVCPGPIEGDRIEQLVRMHAEAEGKSFEAMHPFFGTPAGGRGDGRYPKASVGFRPADYVGPTHLSATGRCRGGSHISNP